MKLFAFPIFLMKPNNHLPRSSLIRPPPPAKPKETLEDPSVLSFIQPELGFSHLTCLITMQLLHLGWVSHSIYSIAWDNITLVRLGLTPLLLKTTWFRCFHKDQMAKGKRMCQGTPFMVWVVLTLVFEASQVLISWEKKRELELWIPNWSYTGLIT